jgi:hypothetical protein
MLADVVEEGGAEAGQKVLGRVLISLWLLHLFGFAKFRELWLVDAPLF